MSYGNYYGEQPRRRTSRALVRLTIFVWLLVFSCVGLRAFAIPYVNDLFYGQINRVVEGVNPQQSAPLPSNTNQEKQTQQLIQQVPLALPTITAGAIAINDQLATTYANQQAKTLGLNNIGVQFVPGGVVATISAPAPLVGEVTGTVRATARVENGRIVLDNETIDGPIGRVISPTTLVNAVENRVNNEIAQQGRSVQSLNVQQGQATIVFK